MDNHDKYIALVEKIKQEVNEAIDGGTSIEMSVSAVAQIFACLCLSYHKYLPPNASRVVPRLVFAAIKSMDNEIRSVISETN